MSPGNAHPRWHPRGPSRAGLGSLPWWDLPARDRVGLGGVPGGLQASPQGGTAQAAATHWDGGLPPGAVPGTLLSSPWGPPSHMGETAQREASGGQKGSQAPHSHMHPQIHARIQTRALTAHIPSAARCLTGCGRGDSSLGGTLRTGAYPAGQSAGLWGAARSKKGLGQPPAPHSFSLGSGGRGKGDGASSEGAGSAQDLPSACSGWPSQSKQSLGWGRGAKGLLEMEGGPGRWPRAPRPGPGDLPPPGGAPSAGLGAG